MEAAGAPLHRLTRAARLNPPSYLQRQGAIHCMTTAAQQRRASRSRAQSGRGCAAMMMGASVRASSICRGVACPRGRRMLIRLPCQLVAPPQRRLSTYDDRGRHRHRPAARSAPSALQPPFRSEQCVYTCRGSGISRLALAAHLYLHMKQSVTTRSRARRVASMWRPSAGSTSAALPSFSAVRCLHSLDASGAPTHWQRSNVDSV